jgi:N-acetylmuramoyl-L-alanine amidase
MAEPQRLDTMARWPAALLFVCAVLTGGYPVEGATAARPASVEVKSGAGSLGRLPLVSLDDGGTYISAERLAGLLKGSWIVKGSRATLTVSRRAAQFTRDQARLSVAGEFLTLEAPARVTAKGWLIPEGFLARGLGKLVPGLTAVRPIAAVESRPPLKRVSASVPFEELRYRSYPSFTRIVVEAGAELSYLVAPGQKEIRVRLSSLAVPGLRVEEIDDGLVKEIRLEATGPDALLKITLDGKAADVRTASLQDPFRVVVDIYRPKDAASQVAPKTNGGVAPLQLIVMDAGHGGHDSGAIGPTGVMEKDVVLDVTRRAARMVEDGLGIKVALSRSTDVFVPLRERTNFANKRRADLFVSIHANAHPRSVSEGVEVYFLSSEATDNEARQTAAIENGVVELENPQSRQKTDMLKSILWDMAQSEFQQESSFLAETVLDSTTRSLRLVNRGVKQAGFYVLGGAAMPAILIEIGFLTNPREEKKLASPEHREALAKAIYAGLAEYKRRYDQRVRTVQTQPGKSETSR